MLSSPAHDAGDLADLDALLEGGKVRVGEVLLGDVDVDVVAVSAVPACMS